MRIALTGATGLLGQELLHSLKMEVIPFPHETELDIVDLQAVRDFVREVRPEKIIHAAASRDIDFLERNPETAWKVNTVGTFNVVTAAREVGAAVCYISTDNVFGGDKNAPYHEFDPVGPVNMYGRTKLAAEQIVRSHVPRHFIFRLPWLFGRFGGLENNWLMQYAHKARSGETIHAACDQWSSVCSCEDVALVLNAALPTDRYGTYHVAGPGSASRAEVARTALEMAGYDPALVVERPAAELGRPAYRSRYIVMRSLLVKEVFGVTLPPWRESLARTIEALRAKGAI